MPPMNQTPQTSALPHTPHMPYAASQTPTLPYSNQFMPTGMQHHANPYGHFPAQGQPSTHPPAPYTFNQPTPAPPQYRPYPTNPNQRQLQYLCSFHSRNGKPSSHTDAQCRDPRNPRSPHYNPNLQLPPPAQHHDDQRQRTQAQAQQVSSEALVASFNMLATGAQGDAQNPEQQGKFVLD